MIIYRIFHCLIFISTEFYIKKKGEKKIFETLISVDIFFSVKIFVLLEARSWHVGSAKTKQFLDPRYEFPSSLDAKHNLILRTP